MSQYMTSCYTSSEGRALDASLELEGRAGGYTPTSLQGHAMDRIIWYNSRYRWLNRQTDAMNPIGDTNIDGTVSISDVTYLIDMLLGSARVYRYAGDVNGDGEVSVMDVTVLIDMIHSVN